MKATEQLNELRGRTAEDLEQRVRELDEQVFRLRLQKSMGQAEAGHKIRPLRQERARIQTVLQQRRAGVAEG
jgi:large subunit ribosomal protein L29